MSPELLYDIFHKESFGSQIALYFFFMGLSTGSFFVSTLSPGFGLSQYRALSKPAIVTATLVLLVGPLFLLLHVGQPLRVWHLFVYLNLGSPITWGSFLLSAYPVLCLLCGYCVFLGKEGPARTWGLLGIPFAIGVSVYSGFILSFCSSRPMWHSSMVPLLFLVSAVVSGTALVILVFAAVTKARGSAVEETGESGQVLLSLGKVLGWVLLLDLVLTGAEILVGWVGGRESRRAVGLLLTGALAPRFLGMELVLGKLIPLGLLLLPGLRKVWTVLLASFLTVVGILFMRLDLVAVGEFFPLL